MPEVTITSKLAPIADDIELKDSRPTMVKVDHVSMDFNMASEKLGSLKEYAIAIAKRQLFFERFTALDDVSLEVKKGDVFGILGTNGSGKSTLLKIIAGVLEPTRGDVKINGNIAPLIELGAGFDMELSARENIFLNGALLGYSKKFIQEHFDDIVSFAEVEKFLDMPMKNYSSGMISRIAFAIATVIVPEILIVDEVLSVGDFMFQQKCENRINDLITNHGVTVLIVSHSNDQIERLCNKAIWIEKGHTRIIGDATQVCNAYRILGGRSGEKTSEDLIYSKLRLVEEGKSDQIAYETIAGENHYELSSNLVAKRWGDASPESIVLVPDDSYVYSIIASSLAGINQAPIIPFSQEEIPFVISRLVMDLNPEKVFIFGYDEAVGNASPIVRHLLPSAEIVELGCERSADGLRLGMAKYVLSNSNMWEDKPLHIVPFSNRDFAFKLAVYSYLLHFPIFPLFENERQLNARLLDVLASCKVDKVVLWGKAQELCTEDLPGVFQTIKMDLVPSSSIASKIDDAVELNETTIVVSSGEEANWQNNISVPSYCGTSNTELMLVNTLSLDDFAQCVETLCSKSTNYAEIVGAKSLSSIEAKVLLSR